MGIVLTAATMSLDGFIADDSDAVGPLFDWYNNGEVALTAADPDRVFHVSAASAAYLTGDAWGNVGVAIVGRRLFDLTNGWGGRPPISDSVVVVTHEPPTDWPFPDAPFTFVTDGLESAVTRALAMAADKNVSITAGNLAGQAFALGLIDEIRVDIAPVVLGSGKRFFGGYVGPTIMLENPRIVDGDRVTHLHYRVRK